MSRALVVLLLAASGCATTASVPDETAQRMDEVLDFPERQPAEPIAFGPTPPPTPDLPESPKQPLVSPRPGMFALRPSEPPEFVTTVRGRRARPHHGVPKIGIPDVVIPEVRCGTVDCGKVEVGAVKTGEIIIGDPIGEIRFMRIDL